MSVWYYFRVSHLLYDLLCMCFVSVSSVFILVIFTATKKIHTDTGLPEGLMLFFKAVCKNRSWFAQKKRTSGYHFLVTIQWDHSKIFETWQPLNELYTLCMGQISDGDCLFHCRPSRRLTQTRRKKTSTRWRANMDSAPQKRNEHCHEHLKSRTSSTSNAISNVNIHLLIFVLFWPFKFLSPSLG